MDADTNEGGHARRDRRLPTGRCHNEPANEIVRYFNSWTPTATDRSALPNLPKVTPPVAINARPLITEYDADKNGQSAKSNIARPNCNDLIVSTPTGQELPASRSNVPRG